MTKNDVLVCKVGGSLWDFPSTFARLNDFQANETGRIVWIAGGGGPADCVRAWDNTFGLGDHRAHPIAIRAMRVGEALLASCLEGNPLVVANRTEAEWAWSEGRTAILNIESWLESKEAPSEIEPSWDVTSDSLAALVATAWNASLLLIKSTTPERSPNQFVDGHFSQLVYQTDVSWWNLRDMTRGSWNCDVELSLKSPKK